MLSRLSIGAAVCGAMLMLPLVGAAAQPTQTPAPPKPYAAFVAGATVDPGLIPIVTKDGHVYLSIAKEQIGADFIETSVPNTGLGGFGPAAGEPYLAPARIIRFERVGNKIVMRWPNTFAQVTAGTPQGVAASQSLPNSVIALVPIVATDDSNGSVLIPADAFLTDLAGYQAAFDSTVGNPMHGYHIDPSRAFFTSTKAFPDNDVLRVSQTWASGDPDTIDNAPDPRSVEVGVTYNIIAAPHDGYVPRISDPRVGYFMQPLLNFQSDDLKTRNVNYVARWNFAPEHPGQPSKATRPLVLYLSSTIPMQYRDTVKQALLTWNRAFNAIGILDAVQVLQQPEDPNWDPEDIHHNMIRWVDTTAPQYGAEALIVTDPRTGEELNVGVNVDAIEGTAQRYFRYIVAPARGIADTQAAENAFKQQYLRSVVLHESGHDLGLQHNFMGSMAYTAKQLQSKAFTSRYGVATSVMEYAPVNVWPKGTPNGDYNQLVLGPYDYYAVKYGYGYVPNAATAEAEVPTLRRWASRWADPTYRFGSDEDAFFPGGHAIDPRVQQFDLTNHPLQWCATQGAMLRTLMNTVNRRFPKGGEAYDDARRAFLSQAGQYGRCAGMAAHTIGGEYLSRSAKGDPHATLPLTAVPRSEEVRAWHYLATGLFSDAAWTFNPNVLRTLTYSEVSSLTGGGSWVYNPSPRHDVSIVSLAANAQGAALAEMYAPLTLQRIDELSAKYSAGSTMSLADLFNWSYDTILGDVGNAKNGVVRRNLQTRYARMMARMWVSPAVGTPDDARALARVALTRLAAAAGSAGERRLDGTTAAQVAALAAIAKQALAATVASPSP